MFSNLRRLSIIKSTLDIKNWGIRQDTPANEIRSIRLLNYICFIGVITGFFYSIIFLFLGDYIPAILDTVLVSLFLPSLILNKKFRYFPARILLILNSNIAVLSVVIVYGNMYPNDLFLLLPLCLV